MRKVQPIMAGRIHADYDVMETLFLRRKIRNEKSQQVNRESHQNMRALPIIVLTIVLRCFSEKIRTRQANLKIN